MRILFETARSAAVAAAQSEPRTGRSLRPPMRAITPEHMRDFRRAQDLVDKMTRSYEAARDDGYNADFRGTYGSANTEMLPSRSKMRARARTLAKDTAHGKAIVRAFKNNVVGDDPFRLDMRVGKTEPGTGKFIEEEETNRVIEAGWRRFGRPENFTVRRDMSRTEAFMMMVGSAVTVGSVIVRHHEYFEHNEFGYAVELLEEDRLQESYLGRSPAEGMFGPGNPIRASVERHPVYQFPLAYWLLSRHPGEFYSQPLFGAADAPQNFRVQVPANSITHFNNLRDRPEQDFGVTELDATMMPLWRIHQYDKSLTLASIASSAKAWWIEKEFPTGVELPEGVREMLMNGGASGAERGAAAAQQGDGGGPAHEVKPADRETLPFGFKMKQADPKFPIEGADEFRKSNARDIAIGVGLSYQDVSGDFQNLGFAAALMCQIPKQDNCKVHQNNMVDVVVRNVFRKWLRSWILSPKAPPGLMMSRLEEYVDAASFKAKRWAFVNPLVQAQTLILMLDAGIMSPQQVQDQLPDGVSIEDLYAQIAEARDEADKHDLTFASGANQMDATTTEPGDDPQDPEKPGEGAPKKKKTGNPVRHRRARIDPAVLRLIDQNTNGHA